MLKCIILLAVSAFASCVHSQALATFTGVDWTSPLIEGRNYTLRWTVGNGQPVSASLWSGNYSQPIFTGVSATYFVYTIPNPIAEGTYSIRLFQGGSQSDISPLFSIFMAPLNTITSANTTVSATATIAAATAAAIGTGIAGSTTYIYFDEHCGCTKAGLVPASTGTPGPNYNAPAMSTSAFGEYTGAGTNLQIVSFPGVLFGTVLIAMLV